MLSNLKQTEDDFTIEPIEDATLGSVRPEGGFCDGCSGCKVIDHRALAADDDFTIVALAMADEPDAHEAWCAGCAGCSGSCRSSIPA